jgi:UDPglucose 6-dehydrogenase
VRVCVLGLGHLGSVTAACLASLGHEVVGLDFDVSAVHMLNAGSCPVAEPRLEELLRRGLSASLHFTASPGPAARAAEVLWVTYDTPVDEDGNADPGFVMAQIERALSEVAEEPIVLISSQLPVGSVGRMEHTASVRGTGGRLRFAYCPENLRLGSSVRDFLHPDRIVVGVRSDQDRQALDSLLGSITRSIEWMSVESAEMTKHAINAFLATSVAFVNEIASICESVGADAKEVERGLKTDGRVGSRAYLSPGAAFSGVTLARDVGFLNQVSREHQVTTPLLSSVLPSNNAHKSWAERKLRLLFADLQKTTIAIWGLAYKAGTDSLQGSVTIALCEWLVRSGATLRVHDPALSHLPQAWGSSATLCADPLTAVAGAHALVVGTAQPDYRAVSADDLRRYPGLVVLDPNRILTQLASGVRGLKYFAVGMPGQKA